MNKCYWITGLSATGKTTLSSLLVDHLRRLGKTVIHLDGDELRQVLSVDVVIAVIGLFKELHKWNRDNIENYIEIFIDTPLSELKRRDPKNLYRDVELGVIKNVAGIDLKIDIPTNPNIHIKWSEKSTIDTMFKELLESL